MRYKVVEGSQSVCECFDEAEATMIADALNRSQT